MLYLVISEPRAERPSDIRPARQAYWSWLDGQMAEGAVVHAYPRVGRGMVAIFDVPSHDALSDHLAAWAELVPAQFTIHALMDADSVRARLANAPVPPT